MCIIFSILSLSDHLFGNDPLRRQVMSYVTGNVFLKLYYVYILNVLRKWVIYIPSYVIPTLVELAPRGWANLPHWGASSPTYDNLYFHFSYSYRKSKSPKMYWHVPMINYFHILYCQSSNSQNELSRRTGKT